MVDRDRLMGRHVSTQQVMQYFDYEHLSDHPRKISAHVHNLAYLMLEELQDSSELTTGLRKLLEAKDCFVRAAL